MSTGSALERFDVVIIGGGPVGMFLGACLIHRGIRCRVLERRDAPADHSRAIGVHPVSLELFSQIGLADDFVRAGVAVRRGHAFGGDGRPLGTLAFDSCPPPYRYVLTVPQSRTESLLDQHLRGLDAQALQRGVEVTRVEDLGDICRVTYGMGDAERTISAAYVVGCDGKGSLVRQTMGVAFEGGHYPDTYLMGDFNDQSRIGGDAAIFLHQDGVIESFPLAQGIRRWVVRTPVRIDSECHDQLRAPLVDFVRRRTGHDLTASPHQMLSAFGVEHYVARHFAQGRLLLAGDAAHVTSPIGGQGMSLGWRDGWRAAALMERVLAEPGRAEQQLRDYSRAGRRAARRGIRHAEMYMRIGRERRAWRLRDRVFALALRTRLRLAMANMFTMRGFTFHPGEALPGGC